jgi:hypothetical protein
LSGRAKNRDRRALAELLAGRKNAGTTVKNTFSGELKVVFFELERVTVILE